MNKISRNTTTIVDEAQRKLDILCVYSDSMCASSIAEEIEECLDKLYKFSDFLGDYEISDLEFIRTFGVYEFIKEADDIRIIENLLDLCESLDFIDSITSHSRFDSDHKRAKRRKAKEKARTHAIQLGTNSIYSENGKLLRSAGKAFVEYSVAEYSFFLGTPKELRNSPEYSKFKDYFDNPVFNLTRTQREQFAKVIRRSKHLVKVAERYEDYTILYHGKYFYDAERIINADNSDNADDQAESIETVTQKGSNGVFYSRHSNESACGDYIKVTSHGAVISDEDSDELWSSEKDAVPMNLHRDKHPSDVLNVSEKMHKQYEDHIRVFGNINLVSQIIIPIKCFFHGFL